MNDPTRARIVNAFDEELLAAPVPAGLRPLSVRAAAAAPRARSNRPVLLALVATVVLVALVATLVVGSRVLRSPAPVPAGSTIPPPPRSSAAVAFDQAHGVMVLFGGSGDSGTGPRSDTWTWDGKLWLQKHPATHPLPRVDFAMAYDAAHRDVVLFGGMAQVSQGKGGQQAVDDTWTWDGSTWKEQHPAHEPAFGYDWAAPSMQFDPITRTVLMYGYTKATSEANGGIHAELWAWDGTDWRQLQSPIDAQPGAALMPGGDRVLFVGTTTWAWDGSAWTALHPRVNIPLSPISSFAYDPQRHELVVLNGSDTWVWDGTSWARQHPSVQPPTMGYMAYVASVGKVVSWADVMSGFDYGMFAWNGTDWSQIEPATVVATGGTGKGGGYHAVMQPDQVAAAVRARVTLTRPVLLPAYLPAWVYDATVDATADGFTVDYKSDERDKSISFGIVVPTPGIGGANASDTFVKFRGALPTKAARAGYAEYFVYDTKDPLSDRWLLWMEPGTMANPMLAGPGVPYFLFATGLTDAEFWQVANSLR
jgi:hypothetical protein